MKSTRIFILLLMFACASLTSSPVIAQSNQDAIVGYYYYFEPKEKEYAQVEVYKDGSKYKGKVAWMQNPNHADGKPKTDIYNKDESKRNRNIIGISIFDGLEYNKNKNRWEGKIYDPSNGDSFKCIVWLESPQKLSIKGFIGSEWMGLNRTITWKKEDEKRK